LRGKLSIPFDHHHPKHINTRQPVKKLLPGLALNKTTGKAKNRAKTMSQRVIKMEINPKDGK